MTPKRYRTRNLADLKPYIDSGYYRIGPHANRHALCEGFTEKDMIAALLYGKELMRYLQDERLLVLGQISPSPKVKIPLHVVAEYAKPRWVDIITAFVPKDPHRVISRSRLAEMLRYDRHVDEKSDDRPNKSAQLCHSPAYRPKEAFPVTYKAF